MMKKTVLLVGSVGLISCSIACQQGDSRASSGGAGDVSSAAPEKGETKPVKLVEGLGPVHHPVSTANVEAQKFFDQGMAYLYGFNHAEAERSFARAAELDPRLAMAQWGRAIVLGPNINLPEIDEKAAREAYAAAQKAMAMSGNATAGERAYINAIAKRYPADPKADWRKPAYDYHAAMGEVMKKYPEDLDAATLYAESGMNLRPWKLYTKEGKPEEGTEEIVSVLEWVIQRNPNHIGALHYYIHAVEASTKPERAVPAADKLSKLAPASGHLVHMPAHIWIRTGNYARAIQANADAAKVDEHYISCCGPKGGFYPAMYYSHNLHFLAVAAAMAGRSAEASDAAAKLDKHLDPVLDQAKEFEGFGAMPLLVAARQAKWGEVLKWPEPKADRHATRAAWHFARGLAFASRKDLGQALAERDKLAVEAEKAKAWPAREALGAQLLRSGDGVAAEKVFRDDLAKTLNNPRSLYGLSESLKARGKHYEAGEVSKQFDQRWQGADVTLRIEDF